MRFACRRCASSHREPRPSSWGTKCNEYDTSRMIVFSVALLSLRKSPEPPIPSPTFL